MQTDQDNYFGLNNNNSNSNLRLFFHIYYLHNLITEHILAFCIKLYLFG